MDFTVKHDVLFFDHELLTNGNRFAEKNTDECKLVLGEIKRLEGKYKIECKGGYIDYQSNEVVLTINAEKSSDIRSFYNEIDFDGMSYLKIKKSINPIPARKALKEMEVIDGKILEIA